MNQTQSDAMRCSVIALAGETNAGKSTLLNCLVGSKLAIVTPKAQTTRTTLKGIVIEKNSQLVFVDTPGIFKPRHTLEKAMVKAAWSGLTGADTVLLLIDSTRGITPQLTHIIDGIKDRTSGQGLQAIAVLNKVDIAKPEMLLPLAKQLDEMKLFKRIFMISAKEDDGVNDVKSYLAENAPPAPWMFPEDQMTDAPMRFLASEITREKLFLRLRQELPYTLMVETEKWEERPPNKNEPAGSVKVHQVVFVQKESHKKIILGKGGASIRSIGEESRKELERMLLKQVHLFLFVKVRENWQDEREHYGMHGLDFPG